MTTKWRRIIIVLLTIIFVPSMICIVIPRLFNQITLIAFAQPFYDYPLPPETMEVSREMEVGVLTGNGNHCDFYANRKFKTLLTEDQIRKYYYNVTFPSISPHSSVTAISGLNGRVGIIVQFDPVDSQYVIVELWDYPYRDPIRMLDTRCH
jgi:hypothetical protein